MRRVNCKECGVTTERVPWACGKNQHTYSFRLFLATWAKRLSLKETASVFMKKFSEALDKVRADETRQLLSDEYETVLKKSRWCILKKRENLTADQAFKLQELLKYNLKTTKAYLMREDFSRFRTYSSPKWASKFLRDWCARANRSGIEPMKRMAKMLERHEPYR